MRLTIDCLRNEEGQSIILVVLAMGIFLLGAVGLGFDSSRLYSERQMAQTAADAAAQAAMMSVFDGTNTGTGGAAFSTSKAFTCGTSDTRTPCVYAAKDGFGATSRDTVTVSFPADSTISGVSFSSVDPTNLIQVTVSRNVPTTLMRLLGASATTATATAEAAIVSVSAPVPILVNHPTMSGAFSTNGGFTVQICGGPQRSVEINSGSSTATINKGSSGTVDLSKAGPADPGNCTTGTGADFGVWGGPSSPSFTFTTGPTSHYLEPASWMADPLANVSAPSVPAAAAATTSVAAGSYGCPAGTKGGCTLYYPGLYATGFDGKGANVVFAPGIYYIQSGGFQCSSNCNLYMATGLTDSGSTVTFPSACCGTSTSWTGNMMVYNTGAGQFNLSANGSVNLTGSPGSSSYKGILFFEDRTAAANNGTVKKSTPHSLGGNGSMTLLGTIYMTNTRATMLGDATHYQELDITGTSGNSTIIQGEIIVDALGLSGNGTITMNLNSTPAYIVRQVALVN